MDPLDPALLSALGIGGDPLMGGGGGVGDPLGGGGGFNANTLLAALKGVPAMKPPEVQKVSTPHAPQLAPIKGNEFFNMLAALGLPGQEAISQYRLPATLTGALGVH